MDQAMLANRVLNVSHAKPEKKAGTLLGSKVAVWEQVWFPVFAFSVHSISDIWILIMMANYRKTGSASTKFRRKIGKRKRRRRWRL